MNAKQFAKLGVGNLVKTRQGNVYLITRVDASSNLCWIQYAGGREPLEAGEPFDSEMVARMLDQVLTPAAIYVSNARSFKRVA
jgi:hypothetical protein